MLSPPLAEELDYPGNCNHRNDNSPEIRNGGKHKEPIEMWKYKFPFRSVPFHLFTEAQHLGGTGVAAP
jgi:hypothetical protein